MFVWKYFYWFNGTTIPLLFTCSILCFFVLYCRHKNTHKQKLTNITKINSHETTTFCTYKLLRGCTNLFCPCLHQHLGSHPFILFICILSNFCEVKMLNKLMSPKTSSRRCTMHLKWFMGTSVFIAFP